MSLTITYLPRLSLLLTAALLALSIEANAQLVADWRMDESAWTGTAGEVVDSSGQGNNGVARGQDIEPTTVPGKVCNAGEFRGQGYNVPQPPFYIDAQHYVEVADADSLSPLAGASEEMTIGGWFRAETLNGTLIHKGEGGPSQEYQVYIEGGRLRLRLWNRFGSPDSFLVSNANLAVDQWYFFSVTIERLGNSNNVRARGVLYNESGSIGGSNQSVISLDYTNKNTGGRLYLGGISFGGPPTNFFSGLLDEFRIYSNVRSEDEIEAHWATTRPCPVASELLVEYRMEQASWTGVTGEVLDTSGFDRHGTAVGGATTDGDEPAIAGNPGTCRYGDLDGGNDGIDDPDADAYLEGLEAVTVMSWVYNTAPLSGNNGGIFFSNTPTANDNRLGLRYDSNGFFGGGSQLIKASVKTDACSGTGECVQVETSSGQMVRNQWQHVAMTWASGGDLKVFVDGVEVGTSNEIGQGTGGVIDSISGLNIGQGATGDRWQGRIDEFRVFRGALSEAEIQDWRDRTEPCEIVLPDHIRILHPGTGLTCAPVNVTLQACADPSCSSYFADEVTVSMTSPAGNWSVNPVTFEQTSSVALQVTTPGFVTLSAQSSPAANGPVQCFVGASPTCQMEWFDSGFILDIPDHIAAIEQTMTVSAVRSDDPGQACAPAFAGQTRTIDFWSGYANPASGTIPLLLDGTPIAGTPTGTGIPVTFNAASQATVPLRYDDAGRVQVNARFEGVGDEAGLVMIGQDTFTARPLGFELDVPDNPEAADAGGGVFIAAGAAFPVGVTARNAAGTTTPNFGRESPAESVLLETALRAPAGGSNPPLVGSFDAFGVDCEGAAAPGKACGTFGWAEVGILDPTPRLASGAYLGTGDVVGPAAAPIGRFIPSGFSLDEASLTDRVALTGCADPFTYLGETLGLDWTLGARNTAGSITVNYEGAFARLDAGQLGLNGDEPIIIDLASVAWTQGGGEARAIVHVDRDLPREPLTGFQFGSAPLDSDGVALNNPDVDLSGDGVDDHGLIGATDLRYGRLVLDNALGSELGPLEIPVRSEYYSDQTWVAHDSDNCTAFSLTDDVGLLSSSGDDTDGSGSVSVGGGTTSISEPDPVTLTGGSAGFTFGAPGAPGWVELTLQLEDRWDFLRDDLDDDGTFDDDPTARANFGLFDGDARRIQLRQINPN